MTILGWVFLALATIQTVRFRWYRQAVRKEVSRAKEAFNRLFQMGVLLGWNEAREHPERTSEGMRHFAADAAELFGLQDSSELKEKAIEEAMQRLGISRREG